MNYAYLDWAATAPADPAACKVLYDTSLQYPGNPSSPHGDGRSARGVLESARSRCARALGISPETVIFTSGGTESNNLVFYSLLDTPNPGAVLVSGIEHPSGYLPARRLEDFGFQVDFLTTSRNGSVAVESILEGLTPDTRLLSVMAVNNETGVVQPIEEIVRAVREHEKISGRKVHIHTDAVQALEKVPIDLTRWDVDSASFSAHKLGGPRGIGILYSRRRFTPLYLGGAQEAGVRPGTENVPAATAFASLFHDSIGTPDTAHVVRLDRLLSEILASIPGCVRIPEDFADAGEAITRSPFIHCLALPPIPGEVVVRVMDASGFRISTGSACSSRKKERGRVLEAMGVPKDLWFSSVRISIGKGTTEEEIIAFGRALRREVEVLGRSVGRAARS
jgi:cysteine desulfurase